tara:strand:- start:656 stop:1768 length:1113 start_codon:yes stop_codon:yes gene_type:complete
MSNKKRILFLKHVELIDELKSKAKQAQSSKRLIYFDNIRGIDDDLIIHISKDIQSIDDLIELGEMYVPGHQYNIDLYRLAKIREPLKKLSNTVGLRGIKADIIKQIMYFLQDFNGKSEDMLHTVLQGPPGVGKTMVGEILGEIYYKLGIIQGAGNEYKFKIIKRSDLIGQYLGTTAKKTQEVINSCLGGVMFIDEAYSLGNEGKQDIYAKECIDTINQNLTEQKGKFLCIIAGYENDLNKCFFRYNEGLRRRFPFVYTLDNYDFKELLQIFSSMLTKDKWSIDMSDDVLEKTFQKNYDVFENMAGDMETLVFNAKLEHSSRVFCLDASEKNKIKAGDLVDGINLLKKNRNTESLAEQKQHELHMLSTIYT